MKWKIVEGPKDEDKICMKVIILHEHVFSFWMHLP
jgi:hypothetical protein